MLAWLQDIDQTLTILSVELSWKAYVRYGINHQFFIRLPRKGVLPVLGLYLWLRNSISRFLTVILGLSSENVWVFIHAFRAMFWKDSFWSSHGAYRRRVVRLFRLKICVAASHLIVVLFVGSTMLHLILGFMLFQGNQIRVRRLSLWAILDPIWLWEITFPLYSYTSWGYFYFYLLLFCLLVLQSMATSPTRHLHLFVCLVSPILLDSLLSLLLHLPDLLFPELL